MVGRISPATRLMIDRVAKATVCESFEPDGGGAHPWCRHCGWQRSRHG